MKGWGNVFKYSLHTTGKLHSSTPVFVDRNRVSLEGFASIFYVDAKTAESVWQAGTTIGYKGLVWQDTLWIDTDSYEAADEVELKLKELGYEFISYDSGGRGAHFGVRIDVNPSHVLPYQCKTWVGEHFRGLADLSIYTHLHLFRLPNTIHERTGRRKEAVGRYPGRALLLPRWEPKSQPLIAPVSSGRGSLFDNKRVLANLVPASNGDRHYQLVRLIYALKDSQGVDAPTATYICSEWNKMCEEPKDEAAIQKAVDSIYR